MSQLRQLDLLLRHRSRQNRLPFSFIAIFASILVWLFAWPSPHIVNAQTPATDAPSLKPHHITLSVTDAEQISQWYADVLGFTIRDRFTLTRADGGQIQVARVEIPGLQMNISEFDGSVPPDRTGERQGWRHLALQVESVDRTYQQLQAQGVPFLGEPFTYDPPGYRIAFFRDPEGNILELYQDL